jgi:outer membrane protein TolC
VKAGLELCGKPSEKVTLLTQYVDATKEAEKEEQTRYENGRISIDVLHRARYQRLDAEIQLLHAKGEADKAKDK